MNSRDPGSSDTEDFYFVKDYFLPLVRREILTLSLRV